METFICPVCGTTEFESKATVGMQVFICCGCTAVFQNPQTATKMAQQIRKARDRDLDIKLSDLEQAFQRKLDKLEKAMDRHQTMHDRGFLRNLV